MASPASIPQYDQPSYPYQQYVEEEAARYDVDLKARIAVLAKRNCRPSIHVPRLVERIVWTYSNKAERMAEAHRLAMTPWPVFNPPIQLVPPTKSTHVQHEEDDEPLEAKYPSEEAEGENKGVTVSPDEREERQEAIADDPAPVNSPKILLRANKRTVTAAFDDFLANKPYAADAVIDQSTRFAKWVIGYKLVDQAEGAITPDDAANEVGLKVWQALSTFVGDSEDFWKWLNKVCKNKSLDTFSNHCDEFTGRLPLMLEDEDGFSEQNPLLNRDQRQQYIRELPDWIQGTDLWICKLIRANRSYAEIGNLLHITEPAVRQRVAKMRMRSLAEAKASGVVKRIRVRNEWVNAIADIDERKK
ncbi:MAG: hypothetical protein BGO25_18175 [Acidobacteriales bacterium 59-55]|nr:sigma-70 family RNA polymerase sigma factor [Terriglobales bacterium]OJV41603.1 MAG: hypothetical protein BGO25_18175 [Acidobacteriales bacterium 59-55]